MTGAGPFHGFSKDAITFLRDLRANNDRTWFNDHKKIYERAIKQPAQAFCAAMTAALEDLTARPHSHKIFRIHRDVRFSKDKTPYNTHLHIAFMPDGKKSSAPAWFFGFDPEGLTLGTGIFTFEKEALERYRQRVLGADGAILAGIIRDLKGQDARLGEPALKRVPSGYPADHASAELLRHKGFSAWIDHPDPMVATAPDLVTTCMGDFVLLEPLFDWLDD